MKYIMKVKVQFGSNTQNLESRSEIETLLSNEIVQPIQNVGGKAFLQPPEKQTYRVTEVLSIPEIIIALGSTGVFAGILKILHKFLESNKNREITLIRKDKKIRIKGHSQREERELLRELFPDLIEPMAKKNQPYKELEEKKGEGY